MIGHEKLDSYKVYFPKAFLNPQDVYSSYALLFSLQNLTRWSHLSPESLLKPHFGFGDCFKVVMLKQNGDVWEGGGGVKGGGRGERGGGGK